MHELIHATVFTFQLKLESSVQKVVKFHFIKCYQQDKISCICSFVRYILHSLNYQIVQIFLVLLAECSKQQSKDGNHITDEYIAEKTTDFQLALRLQKQYLGLFYMKLDCRVVRRKTEHGYHRKGEKKIERGDASTLRDHCMRTSKHGKLKRTVF